MFLLIAISETAGNYNWQKVREIAHSLLPHHESFEVNLQNKTPLLKCTIKKNDCGKEMLAASVRINSVKSRFISYVEEKRQFIDFPRRNIRAWIGEHGNIVIRPLVKEKPYIASLEKGFRKLALLHLRGYLEVLKKELEKSEK